MKKAKKIVALLLCAVLLVGASVAGTLAYLTHKTNTIQNTFTVGKVDLGEAGTGLDEATVDVYGVAVEGAARTASGNSYKLIPGHEYKKDPTVHIQPNSEECWLFVEVVNDIADIEADGETKISAQILAKGWTLLDGNIYYKKAPATGETVADHVVFEKFILADNADVSGYGSAKIEVTAFAVQADGFNTALEAWNATATGFGKTPISATP